MPAIVVTAPAVGANVPFTFTVPGQQTWTILAVSATLSRAVGGTPNRALQLAITDGTTTVYVSPAADAGTEPGTLTVTWANATPSAVSSGATGISLGPLGPVVCAPGYVITGTVLNGVVTDQWTRAAIWVDEQPTGR
jgi:hypothetical protein